MIKNKHLIFALLIILLILKAGTVYAFEVKYPSIVGLPDINQSSTSLAKFVEYFFGLGVYVVGLIATVSFAIGAVGLIMSGGSSDLERESKDRMKGAVIGVIIAVLATLILNVINGNIANLNLNPLPAPSPTVAYEQPGVYFCSGGCDGTKCTGTMSAVMTSNQDYINSTFSNGQIKGIRFVEDLANNIKYGVILHNGELDSVGECSLPIYDTSTSPAPIDCETVNSAINATSANIFAIGNNSAGNDVNFYSDVNGWSNTILSGGKMLSTAGVVKIKTTDFKNSVFNKKAGDMAYDYTNTNVPPGKQATDKTVKNALGSIQIGSNGGYLVAIYSETGSPSASPVSIKNYTKYVLADISFKQLTFNHICTVGTTQYCTPIGGGDGTQTCIDLGNGGTYWGECTADNSGNGGTTANPPPPPPPGSDSGVCTNKCDVYETQAPYPNCSCSESSGNGGTVGGSSSVGNIYCQTITSSIGDVGAIGIVGPNGSQLNNIYIFSTR